MSIWSIFDNSNGEYIKAKLINGGTRIVKKTTVVGYCSFPHHKGFITKTLLKSHDCENRKCRYFKKYKDSPHWNVNQQDTAVQELIETIQEIADSLQCNVRIIYVEKMPYKNVFTIYYTSENENDPDRHLSLVQSLEQELESFIIPEQIDSNLMTETDA